VCGPITGQVEWAAWVVTGTEEECWDEVTYGRINPRSSECTRWNDATTSQWSALTLIIITVIRTVFMLLLSQQSSCLIWTARSSVLHGNGSGKIPWETRGTGNQD